MPIYKRADGSFRIVVWANNKPYERSCRGNADLALRQESELREQVGAKRKDIAVAAEPDGAAEVFWIGGAKSYVYFIQQGVDGPIKIGFGENARLRVRAMQTGNPHRLRLRCVIPGGRLLERALHRAFDKQRMEGEWFRPTIALRALVDEICSASKRTRNHGRPPWQPPKS